MLNSSIVSYRIVTAFQTEHQQSTVNNISTHPVCW